MKKVYCIHCFQTKTEKFEEKFDIDSMEKLSNKWGKNYGNYLKDLKKLFYFFTLTLKLNPWIILIPHFAYKL